MSRLKELRKYVDAELNKMEDADKRTSAIAHLYGVSLVATMIANRRIMIWHIRDCKCRSWRKCCSMGRYLSNIMKGRRSIPWDCIRL